MLRLLFGELYDRVKRFRARRRLERKLGRKVADHELYSIATHMDAADGPGQSGAQQSYSSFSQPMPEAQPRSRAKKFVLLAVVLCVVIAGGGLYVMNMSEHDFNRLNPFSPKPPAGAFQPQIGRYKLSGEPSHVKATNIGNGKYFYAYYKPTSGTSIQYALWSFPSAAEAKQGFETEKKRLQGYAAQGTKMVQQDGSRFATVWLKDGQASACWLDGARMVRASGKDQTSVYEFEGLLRNQPPASVVEVQLEPGGKQSGTSELSVTVADLLRDYQKDPAAADKKYKSRFIVVTGLVEVAERDKKGNPMVGFMKPGAKSPTEGMVVCSFDKSQDAAVSAIKKGQTAQVKGHVFGAVVGNVILDRCSKL